MGRPRKYTLNINYFDNINSEEKAYFLGFLYADGHNQKTKGTVRLILSKKDDNILKKFAYLVETNNPIKYNVITIKGKKYDSAGLYMNSVHMCKKLESYGMTQKKSLTVEFPYINNKYLHHFIRGYFDGDGSITINKKGQPKISICGSKPFLIVLRNIFRKKCRFKSC